MESKMCSGIVAEVLKAGWHVDSTSCSLSAGTDRTSCVCVFSR